MTPVPTKTFFAGHAERSWAIAGRAALEIDAGGKARAAPMENDGAACKPAIDRGACLGGRGPPV
jgi:hypothetical protein